MTKGLITLGLGYSSYFILLLKDSTVTRICTNLHPTLMMMVNSAIRSSHTTVFLVKCLCLKFLILLDLTPYKTQVYIDSIIRGKTETMYLII